MQVRCVVPKCEREEREGKRKRADQWHSGPGLLVLTGTARRFYIAQSVPTYSLDCVLVKPLPLKRLQIPYPFGVYDATIASSWSLSGADVGR